MTTSHLLDVYTNPLPVQAHFPPGRWTHIQALPSAFAWHVVYTATVASPWQSSLDASGQHLLLTNTISKQSFVYQKAAPPRKGETVAGIGLGAVADDTPTGTGLTSADQTQVEANPTPDVPQGTSPSAPMQPVNADTVVTTSGDPNTLLWVLGGLVLVAGSLAAYTYSKKHRSGPRRKKSPRRRN